MWCGIENPADNDVMTEAEDRKNERHHWILLQMSGGRMSSNLCNGEERNADVYVWIMQLKYGITWWTTSE